jgi:hypothetical protein
MENVQKHNNLAIRIFYHCNSMILKLGVSFKEKKKKSAEEIFIFI